MTVIVGAEDAETKDFRLHRSIICVKSAFFEMACKETFIEGLSKVIKLPEVDVETFNALAQWMYDGGYNLPQVRDKNLDQIIRIFAAADFLQMPGIKAEILGGMTTELVSQKAVKLDRVTDPFVFIDGICEHVHREDWKGMRDLIEGLFPWWFLNKEDMEKIIERTGSIYTAVWLDVYQTIIRKTYCSKCCLDKTPVAKKDINNCVTCGNVILVKPIDMSNH